MSDKNQPLPPAQDLDEQQQSVILDRGSEINRVRLRVILKLLSLLGLFAMTYVLFASFLTTQPDEKDFETLRIDASAQLPGKMSLYNWNGRPVLILRRSPAQIATLRQDTPGLLDPTSAKSEQPSFAAEPFRSRVPEWFVAIALGTDLSCGIVWLPESREIFAGLPWAGGFADSCNGFRYDLAGRVYSGQRARRNLPIPHYSSSTDGVFLLGGREDG